MGYDNGIFEYNVVCVGTISNMKKIRHSKLPITLESSDRLTPDFLKAISLQMEYKSWSAWIDEYGSWFNPQKHNPKQMELFNNDN